MLLKLVLIISLCGALLSLSQLSSPVSRDSHLTSREALYLPSQETVRFLSFGYSNALARVLWFRTVSYFGKHFRSDKVYAHLFHMCDLVNTLDPRSDVVPEFGALMLAWESNDGARSAYLLDRALERNPSPWRYWYVRAMTRLMFLQDREGAGRDLLEASKKPGAPPFVARMAAKELSYSDPTMAIDYLRSMVESAPSDAAQRALRAKLKSLERNRDILQLGLARDAYEERFEKKLERVEQLIESGMVRGLSEGIYYYDEATRQFERVKKSR